MEQQRQYIASQIRAARLARGYTQLDLSQKTNISLRSIQRIESAQVNPRAYTLGILSVALELQLQPKNIVSKSVPNHTEQQYQKTRTAWRILIAVIAGLCLALFAASFLSQSPAFPETTFELFMFWAAIVSLYLFLLRGYFKN